MARFQVIGINDKRDFCECCGKSGLQRVVWILDTETGDEKHFGTSCAAKPAKGFDCLNEMKAAIRQIDAKLKASLSVAAKRYRALGGTYTNGRDGNGFAISSVDNVALWEALKTEEAAKVYGQ